MWLALLLAGVAAFPVRRVEERSPLLGGTRDGIYVAELTVASAPVLLVVDTGSPALGLVQRGCVTFEANAPCPAPPSGLVDLSSSHSVTCSDLPLCCKANGQACSVTLAYLDGTQAVGNVYTARTSLGNGTESFLVGVRKTQGRFSSSLAHGILGLSLGTSSVPSLMEQVGVVALCMSEYGGDIAFGAALDASKRKSELAYVPVVSSTQWQVVLRQIVVGTSGRVFSASEYETVVDSGTTLIVVPSPLRVQIVELLRKWCDVLGPGPGAFMCNEGNDIFSPKAPGQCYPLNVAVLPQLPELNFVFSDTVKIVVPPAAYIRFIVQENDATCGMFGIAEMDSQRPNLLLLGDVFLRNAYTVFDGVNKRIGFATPNCSYVPITGGGNRSPVVIVAIVAIALVAGVVAFVLLAFSKFPSFSFLRRGGMNSGGGSAAAAAAAARRLPTPPPPNSLDDDIL